MGRRDRYRTPAEKKKRFLRHLRVYLVMSIFFVILNLLTSDVFWAIFPILGWGLGVALEGFSVYGPLRDRDDEYESDEFFDLDHNRPDHKIPEAPKAAEPRGFREEDLV